MGWFRRRDDEAADSIEAEADGHATSLIPGLTPEGGSPEAIDRFWRWWKQERQGVTAAIPAGRLVDYVDVMTDLVGEIHPDLLWQFGPGVDSAHCLMVGAGGDPRLRAAARRWLAAAPEADHVWSYVDLKPAAAPAPEALQVDGRTLLVDLTRFTTHRTDTGLDVGVFHPDLAGVSAEERSRFAFLVLDLLLGEETVELWIDAVDGLAESPEPLLSIEQVHEEVAQVVREGRPEGEMSWRLLEGEGPDGPVLIRCRARLSSVQAPLADRQVAVHLPCRDMRADGQPGPGSVHALAAFQEELDDIVAGHGLLVATVTGGGERVLHYYVDSTSDRLPALVELTAEWVQGAMRIESSYDPAWEAMRPFRS